MDHPTAWPWSSYPGYVDRDRGPAWVAHDDLLASWAGATGGTDPAGAYRRFVTAGLAEPQGSPWEGARHGWILGSQSFADRVGAMIRGETWGEGRRELRLARAHSLERACEVVCSAYGIGRADLGRRGSRHPARAALAYLARRRTAATNADLMSVLGVSRPESVPNLTPRFAARLSADVGLRCRYRRLEEVLDGPDPVPAPSVSVGDSSRTPVPPG